MSIPALNHRHISNVVKRTGEGVKPREHLRPVDIRHAQPLSTAPQLAAVLGGDVDVVGHPPDFNRHPVGKSRLFQCCHAKAAHGQVPEAQGAVPSPAGDAAGIMQGKLLFNSGKKRVGASLRWWRNATGTGDCNLLNVQGKSLSDSQLRTG